MIIPKANKLDPNQISEIEKIAADFDCSILEIQGRNRCVYAILGDEGREVMFKRIAGLSLHCQGGYDRIPLQVDGPPFRFIRSPGAGG
jgi:hypothetical protein